MHSQQRTLRHTAHPVVLQVAHHKVHNVPEAQPQHGRMVQHGGLAAVHSMHLWGTGIGAGMEGRRVRWGMGMCARHHHACTHPLVELTSTARCAVCRFASRRTAGEGPWSARTASLTHTPAVRRLTMSSTVVQYSSGTYRSRLWRWEDTAATSWAVETASTKAPCWRQGDSSQHCAGKGLGAKRLIGHQPLLGRALLEWSHGRRAR